MTLEELYIPTESADINELLNLVDITNSAVMEIAVKTDTEPLGKTKEIKWNNLLLQTLKENLLKQAS